MNDKELLAQAAKAAGIVIDEFDVMGNAVLDWHNNVRWNPLTDDGDALRLAADLGIDLHFSGRDGHMATASGTFAFSDFHNDRRAATRSAIVRAAAEIGKRKG